MWTNSEWGKGKKMVGKGGRRKEKKKGKLKPDLKKRSSNEIQSGYKDCFKASRENVRDAHCNQSWINTLK